MSIEDRILDVVASQVGWFGGQELRAIALDVRKLEERITQLEREIELFREHADYGDVSLVEAILKGEEIGRKEKESKP